MREFALPTERDLAISFNNSASKAYTHLSSAVDLVITHSKINSISSNPVRIVDLNRSRIKTTVGLNRMVCVES